MLDWRRGSIAGTYVKAQHQDSSGLIFRQRSRSRNDVDSGSPVKILQDDRDEMKVEMKVLS
jgi:hypothetical protein